MLVYGVRVSDNEVRDAVLRKLRLDSRRRGAEVGVKVAEATVTLSGVVGGHEELPAALEGAAGAEGAYKVSTWAERQAVLASLRGAPGVERVQDQLSIDPYC